jgi:hypothetical protein
MSYLLIVLSLGLVALGRYLLKFVKQGKWVNRISASVLIGFLWLCSICLIAVFLIGHLLFAEVALPTASSPDRETSSRIWVDWGPATEPFYSSVELRSMHAGLSPSGIKSRLFFHSVFFADVDPRVLRVEWNGDHDLKIRYPPIPPHGSQIRCDSVWRDVRITCDVYEPNPNDTFPKLPEPDHWRW